MKIHFSPFLRQILTTALTAVVTVACLAVMTRALAQGLGPEGFGAISLVRRVVATLEPLITLGTSISIARFVALSRDSVTQTAYLRSGVFLVTTMTVLLLGTAYVFTGPLSHLLFGATTYVNLYLAMLVLLAGYSIYISLYAYYRGVGKMDRANLWQLAAIAVGPTVVALCLHDAVAITYWMAAFLGAALLPLSWEYFRGLRGAARAGWDGEKVRQMFRYGFGRIPGGLLFGGMMTIGPVLAPHFTTLSDTGFLVVGQSILKIVESGFEAFGRVALPAMASIVGNEGKLALQGRVSLLLEMIFDIGCFATVQALVGIPLLVVFWLGPEYAGAVPLVRVMALALTPYLAFVTLRAVFDAMEERAITTRYLWVGFAVTTSVSIGMLWCGHGALSLAAGATVGFYVLGGLCVHRLGQELQLDWRSFLRGEVFLWNLLFGALAFGLLWGVGTISELSLPTQAWVAISGEIVLFLGYLAVRACRGAGWVLALRSRVGFTAGKNA